MKHFLIGILLILSNLTEAQDKQQLAAKPPLGWNSFDCYAVYLHEKAANENLDAFAEKLKPYGYEYFVIDAGWYGEFKLVPGTMYPMEKHAEVVALDEYGRLEPSQTYFPHGLKPLIEKTHELGVKFGIHMMRGIPRKAVEFNTPIVGTKYHARDIADTTSICAWNHQNYGVDMSKPGAQEYYNSVYQKLADWGVDFVKVDDLVHYPKEIIAISKAIQNSGRSMVYSLSPGGSTNLKDLPYYTTANMVRVTHDIWDDEVSIKRSFDAMKTWQGRGYPTFWADLDMIPFGQLQLMQPIEYKTTKEANKNLAGKGFKRTAQFTKAQMRVFITQRALFASPLMFGGDLPTLDEFSLSLITNKDMLACNQNGHPATLITENDGTEIWGTAVPSVRIEGWIGIFNRTESVKEFSLSKSNLGLVTYFSKPKSDKERVVPSDFFVRDIWGGKEFTLSDDKINITIEPNDVLFIYYQEITE